MKKVQLCVILMLLSITACQWLDPATGRFILTLDALLLLFIFYKTAYFANIFEKSADEALLGWQSALGLLQEIIVKFNDAEKAIKDLEETKEKDSISTQEKS